MKHFFTFFYDAPIENIWCFADNQCEYLYVQQIEMQDLILEMRNSFFQLQLMFYIDKVECEKRNNRLVSTLKQSKMSNLKLIEKCRLLLSLLKDVSYKLKICEILTVISWVFSLILVLLFVYGVMVLNWKGFDKRSLAFLLLFIVVGLLATSAFGVLSDLLL